MSKGYFHVKTGYFKYRFIVSLEKALHDQCQMMLMKKYDFQSQQRNTTEYA